LASWNFGGSCAVTAGFCSATDITREEGIPIAVGDAVAPRVGGPCLCAKNSSTSTVVARPRDAGGNRR
jgi:hypothetical protein